MKGLHIREENEKDHARVESLVHAAFMEVAYSDHTEHLLVRKLRSSRSFIPELSLVAEYGKELAGHILLTKISLDRYKGNLTALALAPLSVQPIWQNKGIGSALILAAHQKAEELGFALIALAGHAEYYPRFGYVPSCEYGIHFPFELPDENALVKELTPGALEEMKGKIIYDPAFTL